MLLVFLGVGALFGWPILTYVTLWALALASTYTVVFRVRKVYLQTVEQGTF